MFASLVSDLLHLIVLQGCIVWKDLLRMILSFCLSVCGCLFLSVHLSHLSRSHDCTNAAVRNKWIFTATSPTHIHNPPPSLSLLLLQINLIDFSNDFNNNFAFTNLFVDHVSFLTLGITFLHSLFLSTNDLPWLIFLNLFIYFCTCISSQHLRHHITWDITEALPISSLSKLLFTLSGLVLTSHSKLHHPRTHHKKNPEAKWKRFYM